MNVLIVSSSIVNGSIIENALKNRSDFKITLISDLTQVILDEINAAQEIDVIIFIANRITKDLKDKLEFLNHFFGAPIFLLEDSNLKLQKFPWLISFPNFSFNITDSRFNAQIDALISKLKTFKSFNQPNLSQLENQAFEGNDLPLVEIKKSEEVKIIAMGASTGGPQVLHYIFQNLSADIPVPILVVQHMPADFLPLFINWLDKDSALKIQLANHNEIAKAGHVYFAPGDLHMVVNSGGRIELIDEPARHSVKPAVSCLFESVAEVYGPRAIGILLTGMGKDGAAELRLMKEKGALTIIQSKESCVVFGMPGAAFKLGAAELILSPAKIVQHLNQLFLSKIGV